MNPLHKSVFFIGGHLSPALAVIDGLKEIDPSIKSYYVGRMRALEGDSAMSLEYKSVTKNKIKFLPITTGRLQRHFSFSFFTSLVKIPIGFFESFSYLLKFKPDLVVGFGGYVSFPVCLSAYLLGIPYIIHEQTSKLGLANRVLSKGAKIIMLGQHNVNKLKNDKIIHTGIPYRKYNEKDADRTILKFGDAKKPLILVSGGSLGSQSINHIIKDSLADLLVNYRVLHQTGSAENNIDFNSLIQLRETLTENLSKNYRIVKDLEYDTFYYAMKNAHIIIGRSGANTCHDIEKLNKSAILIPLPWSGSGEQLENARRLERKGIAVVMEQETMDSHKLIKKIEVLIKKKNSPPIEKRENNPAKLIAEKILEIIY